MLYFHHFCRLHADFQNTCLLFLYFNDAHIVQSFCRGHDESLLVHDMDVADKSVATDDLPAAVYDTRAEVARLEAVLNSLVEQKVDAMKHSASGRKFIRAVSSASPKTLAKRLRIASLSTSIADRDRERDESTRYSKRKRRRHQKAHKG